MHINWKQSKSQQTPEQMPNVKFDGKCLITSPKTTCFFPPPMFSANSSFAVWNVSPDSSLGSALHNGDSCSYKKLGNSDERAWKNVIISTQSLQLLFSVSWSSSFYKIVLALEVLFLLSVLHVFCGFLHLFSLAVFLPLTLFYESELQRAWWWCDETWE